MEKISYTASYTRISLYAQVSSSASAKQAKDANASAADDAATDAANGKPGNGGIGGKTGNCQRNKDGDTFTLSIEAQTIQISGSYTVDDSGGAKSPEDLLDRAGSDETRKAAAKSHALDLAGLGATDDGDDLSGGFVKALLDAMEKRAGKGQHKRHHHLPQLGDSQDVADQMLEHLHRRHAEQGGSKADLADDIKKRLDDWKPSSRSVTVEYREFRSEVHGKLTAGLDSWLAGTTDSAIPQNPAAGSAQDPVLGSGSALEA